MYAIKIVNNLHTYMHLADEVNFVYKKANSREEFYSEVENGEGIFVVGEVLDGKFEYVELYLHTDQKMFPIHKLFYIMPTSWVYIMQEGKTIEAILVQELIQQNVEV